MFPIVLLAVATATIVAVLAAGMAAQRARRARVAWQRNDAPDVRARRNGL